MLPVRSHAQEMLVDSSLEPARSGSRRLVAPSRAQPFAAGAAGECCICGLAR